MRVVFRPPLWKRLVGSTLLVLAAGALVRAHLGVWRYPAWAVAALLAGVVVRFWFLRVRAGTDDLVIVNWVRRHRVPWPDVTRCSYGFGLTVSLRDGGVLGSSAFPFSRMGFEGDGRRAAAELEAVRRRRQGDVRRRRKEEQRQASSRRQPST